MTMHVKFHVRFMYLALKPNLTSLLYTTLGT
jgi:hypothetical protein